MTDNTQPEALRALAEAAKWTGKWYDNGCNTVYCTYDKEDSILHDEIAHPVPFGVSGYIAAAHPQAVIALLDRIAELESELEAVGAGGVQTLSAAPAIKPLVWSDESGPTDKIRYNHITAETALGQFSVEWRGWKEEDGPCVYLAGDYIGVASDLGGAKMLAEQHIRELVANLLAASPTPPAEQQAAPKAAPVKACVCGEPQASGTVHRVNGPCYVAAPKQEVQEPVGVVEHAQAQTSYIHWTAAPPPNGAKLYTAPQPAPATRQAANYPPLPTAIGFAHFFEGELINAHSPRFQAEFNEEGEFDDHSVELFTADQMRAYVDADRTARASAESAERDAERYRWLRAPRLAAGQGSITVELDDRANGDFSRSIFLADLDSAIDAALAAQGGK